MFKFSFRQLKSNNEAKVKIKETMKNKDALLGRTLR